VSDDRIESIEERIYILRDKAAREGFVIPDEVLDYIAEKYALPQTLKGALINVQAFASRRGTPVDMPTAMLVLDGIRPTAAPVELTPEATAEIDAFATSEVEPQIVQHVEWVEGALDDGERWEDVPGEEPEYAHTDAVLRPEPLIAPEPEPEPVMSLEDTLAAMLDADVQSVPEPHAPEPHAPEPAAEEGSLFVAEAEPVADVVAPDQAAVIPFPAPPHAGQLFGTGFVPQAQPEGESAPETAPEPAPEPAETAPEPAPEPAELATPAPAPKPATVWFAPARTTKKQSLVTRAGTLLQRAGLSSAIEEGDMVAIKLHFGEEGNTGFVNPVFLREVVRLVREAGGKPFLTDSNTLYRGQRCNAVDHLECALHNGFSYATVNAPLIIADGLDGRDAVDVPIEGFDHFDSVRIGAAAVHADAMVVVTHVKGHEATGFGGAMKNVGMGLGSRSAKQRMHSDLKPQVSAEKCTACGRCVKWCPVEAITIGPDRVATIDYELCYGCGECVASCSFGAIGIQWKTEPDAIQEKIVEHVAGVLADKEGKVVYLSFITNVSPDCDCWHFSDASIVPDVGVVAGNDIVAVDQASYDLVIGARGVPGTLAEGMGSGVDKFREITGIDGTLGIAYAEKHGLGTATYELKTLD